jgi:hypothetical protein
MSFRCPSCNRVITDRRRGTCAHCNKPLPDSHRLSPTQQSKLERLRAEEAKRHREFMERDISTGGGGAPDLPTSL